MAEQTEQQPIESTENRVDLEDSTNLVTFRLGSGEYAIDIMQAKEIIKMEKITLIPNAPDFVEGVINLRGNIIPIIDLKKRFNLEETEGDKNTGIIIVKIEDVDMGIIIDSISKVVSISNSDIQPPPPMLSGIGQKYIKGVGKLEDKLLVVLDLEKLFTTDEEEEETASADS
ncbi:chemotaxis protein CheW [Brachyspira hyodysenteriae]|uniref:Chemotaxis protein CheW n=2 Tax=Brachyspira hyodysenteriae TaxID=159 RepID=A0A3B6W0A6_BRAHO|nr:chemotaxis protein CheW [Brachyspira hyodysenteriae]ANN63199.1 chemotaxis protein CheW [Brachyspira hyodysenteriae ATCC 27164]AUJ50464.1 chemotaxis protein CheW [Brachyspira hyodysenteriae]KLI16723.1 chemotaxis protein CheW [Brachyspira hyodysenteriae]KLI22028.1 chemotaxis protein CheW [Brachyspira hyodysenteriae]KLI24719.1 chemotaxis protein CheW [Brachyspira hyodysenteriae]